VFHLSDEVLRDCCNCGATDKMHKMLTRFMTISKKNRKPEPGQITEDFIEEARLDLHQQKNDLDKKR